MSWFPFKAFYFLCAGLTSLAFVHAITILGWHNWSRIVGVLPVGELTGVAEVALFGFVGVASFWFAGRELRVWSKRELGK